MDKAANLETRIIRKPLELRAVKGDDGGDVFTGYVFAWDSPSEDMGGFREVIKKGAASKFLASKKNLFAVLDHEKKVEKVLGDMNKGRLKLWEDDKGLAFRIEALPTAASRDAALAVSGTDVGMSFGFIMGVDAWSVNADGSRLRTISEFADLDDISIVVDAAYKSSDVTVAKRSLEEAMAAEKKQEAPELRAAAAAAEVETPEGKETGMSVEILRRELDLVELEHRCYPMALATSDERREEPTHSDDAGEAHRFSQRAFDAKRETGAPSRALELAAAAAHDKAAASAKTEKRAAAEKFHQAAADMHRAAATDCYAGDYDVGGYNYRERVKAAVETRNAEGGKGNPHHDENGQFHDGSPKSILSAAAGKMQKAELRNAEAVNAWNQAQKDFGFDHELTAEAAGAAVEARAAHAAAIDAAEAAIPQAEAAHAALLAEHRTACTESRTKLSAMPVIGSDVSPTVVAQAESAPVE